MKSVFFRATGKFLQNPAEARNLPAHQTVRNNQIFEAQFLNHTGGRSIFVGGDRQNGGDFRLNAVGDSIDNATGFQITMDSLTYVIQSIIEQKFFKIAPADFMPVVVGEGAYSDSLQFRREFSTAEDFEAGNIQTASADARLSSADIAMDSISQKVMDWGKTISYNILDVEKAIRANSWDIIAAKHRARKQNFDLGIQKLAFLGSVNDARFPGLLTNTAFTVNTALITKYIKTMTASELQTFIGSLISTYFTATGNTVLPDTFIMPALDLLGTTIMVNGTNGTYPVPLIDYLQTAFERAARGMGIVANSKQFRILGLPYADAANNPANKNYYMLYRNDQDSIRLSIPLPYTVTQAASRDNFTFNDVAYAEYTGLMALRPAEALIFTF